MENTLSGPTGKKHTNTHMKETLFNFRDVMNELGMSLHDSKRNQTIGRLLTKWAQKHDISRQHILTDKTNPSSSVKAPHCICSYPYAYFDSAVSYSREKVNPNYDKQLLLNFS